MIASADLAAEMRASVAALTLSDAETLCDLGVPAGAIDLFQLIGRAAIRVEGELFQPDPDGLPAFVTPVLCHSPVTPESPWPGSYCRLGALVDLVAWHPAHSQRWALRTGAAAWLGCIPVQFAELAPEPVPIWRSPLTWLRADSVGLALLTRDRGEGFSVLSGITGGIVAEDEAHAAELRALLRRPFPIPRVAVGREARCAA
ncbi:MAG: hypothetical protein JO038_07210 [Alphaproteobacteria bacterium]|nr:hypothetical protein [Alphaproteobacteria bacterium]